jgi:hypothetical protein
VCSAIVAWFCCNAFTGVQASAAPMVSRILIQHCVSA